MVQDIQTAKKNVKLVVIGDFNAFEFTDGYVDLSGIVKGRLRFYAKPRMLVRHLRRPW